MVTLESLMKLLFGILIIFLISCGGGGGSTPVDLSPNASGSGAAPTGSFAGQVDPVQSTD